MGKKFPLDFDDRGTVKLADNILITNSDTGVDEFTTVEAILETGAGGSGDMTKAVYDPTSVLGDAFDMDNMSQGSTNKYVTDTDITNLGNLKSAAYELSSAFASALGEDDNYVTDAQLVNFTSAYDHISESGESHGYINQDVQSTSSPTFVSPTINSLQTNLLAAISVSTGEMAWNADEGTFDFGLLNGVVWQGGQEHPVLVKNQTGSTIANGTPVMFAGTTGASGRVKVMPAIADGTYLAGYMLGLTTQDIENGDDGYVVPFGKIRSIQTDGANYGETWVNGDLIFVSAITAGYLTKVAPEAPNLRITVGIVVYVHASNGTLFSRPTWRGTLVGLDDVNGTALDTNGQMVIWDNDNSYFDFTHNINNYQLSLGYTAENVANKSINVVTDASSDTKYPSVKAIKDYADSLVVGLIDDRGSYDASSNVYPSTGGSGSGGAILKGDLWYISVAGTLGGIDVEIGDSVRALADSPAQVDANWNVLNVNIGYVPENIANKVTSISGASTDTQYGSAKLLYDQLALKADVGQTFYIGTTQVAINRASAALTLAGLTLTTPDIGTPSAGILTNCTFPTLNQNTSGTAAGLSETLVIGSGGTGQTTAQLAINALSAVSAATDEYVLTKDTSTGNALWKVVAGGGIGGAIADNQVAVGAITPDEVEGSSGLTYDGTNFFAITGGKTFWFRASNFEHSASLNVRSGGYLTLNATGYTNNIILNAGSSAGIYNRIDTGYDLVVVSEGVGIGTNSFGAFADNVFAIANGIAPTSNISNQVNYYALAGEAYVMDSVGVVNKLSGAAIFASNVTVGGTILPRTGTAATDTLPAKFTDGVLASTPVKGALEFADSRFWITNVAHQRAVDRSSDVAVSTITVSNTTTETTIWTGTMNANSLVAGNLLKFHADGIVSNAGPTSADQFTIRVRVGGTEMASLTPAAGNLSSVMWHIDANATQRTLGATGSRAMHLHLSVGDDEENMIAVGTIDTTANMDVTITVEWASANTSNIVSLYQGYMEYKN